MILVAHFYFKNVIALNTLILECREYNNREVKIVALEFDSPSSHLLIAEGI